MWTNPARFVYGTVVVGSLLAAESAIRETYLDTVLAVAIALLVYWLAHGYAEFTARRLAGVARLTVSALGRSMAHESPLLLGASLPLVVLIACWIGHVHLTTAVTAAIWTSVAMTATIEVIAALRAHLSGGALVLQSAIGLALGVLVIAIKLILH